ncbi:MAG: COG1615 family transporter, partial [Sphaerospermopsis sp. SIO1G2]|nr:COG1615 family transporter [Sphaerospermopsis sp. SIO1G2]
MDIKLWLRVILFSLGLWLILSISSYLGAETFWFHEVGYLQSFLLRKTTQSILFLSVSVISLSYLLGNLILAKRWKYHKFIKSEPARLENTGLSQEIAVFLSPQYDRNNKQKLLAGGSKSLRLRWLVPIILILSVLLGLIITHYGKVGISYWQEEINQVSSPITILLRPQIVGDLIIQIFSQYEYIVLALIMAIALLMYTQLFLWAIAIIFSLGFGWMVSKNWDKILLHFHSLPFNHTEPLFNQDISFYIFSLPLWELLAFWLIGLSFYGLIAVALTYLLSGDSLSQGIFPGFSAQQKRHLLALGSYSMLMVAFSYWLSRYELVYSPRGVSFGASFTDVMAELPADTILCV